MTTFSSFCVFLVTVNIKHDRIHILKGKPGLTLKICPSLPLVQTVNINSINSKYNLFGFRKFINAGCAHEYKNPLQLPGHSQTTEASLSRYVFHELGKYLQKYFQSEQDTG